MKIRTQVTLALVGIALASSLIMAGFSFLAARDIGVDVFVMHQSRQTEMLASVAGAALEKGDLAVLQRQLDALKQMPMVDYAYIVGPDGRIILHTDPGFAGQPIERWRASPAAAQALELASPVVAGGKDAGYARVGFSSALSVKLGPAISKTLLPRLGLLSGLGTVFGILLGIGLAFYISQPIEAVTEAARKLGGGELNVQVPISASSEAGELVRQFNVMASRLKELDELKDEFIANVSHDLRNPMAAIQMSADYLLNMDPARDQLLPKHRSSIENMMTSAARLSVFVTNILDRAKMKAGKMEYRIEPVAVQNLAKDQEALYAVVARHRKLSLTLEFPADLPRAMADPQKLEHVLSNLLSNALKYTPEGGAIALKGRAADGRVELCVSDTGKGISKDALPRLFRRFEQDTETTAAAKGQSTGLGLYIVKQTVERMGGQLRLESEPGKGTRVFMSFPAAPAPSGPPTPAPKPAPRQATVLVVDDDPSFAEMTKLVLESLGYAAVVVGGGDAAVSAVKLDKPDLILMDMDLRDRPGADVIKELKADAASKSIPVILCSAVKDLSEVYRGLESGAEFFLRKPLNPRELDARIKRILAS